MFWTEALGALPLDVYALAALPSPDFTAATQPSVSDAVFLIELEPSTGVPEEPQYVAMTLGTFPLGTLPYPMPPSGEVNMDFSDRDWTSRPTDDRANVHFEGRAEPPEIDRTAPLTPGTARRVTASIGEIVVSNADGDFDTTPSDLAIDGRAARVRLLPKRSSLYADSVVTFDGAGLDWWSDRQSLHVRVRDASYLLDVPLLALFGGTGGADGSTENTGKPIPQAYGICRGIPGVLVDPVKLIWMFHDRLALSVDSVMEGGAPITPGTGYASYGALAAASTAGGTFDWALSGNGSFWRLGSSPLKPITADVHGDALDGYEADTANIIKRLLLRGVSIDRLGLASFASMSGYLPGAIGVYFGEQITIADAASFVAGAAACFWGDVGDGLFSVGRLAVPSASTGLAFGAEQIVDEVEPLALPDEVSPALWRVTVGYRRNWAPIAGADTAQPPAITEDRRLELAQPYRTVPAEIINRTSRNLLAKGQLLIESLFDDQADALALGNNLLSLYAPGRGLWRVPVGLAGYQTRLNQTIFVKWPRYGLRDGKAVRVAGRRDVGRKVDLLVFG